LEISFSMDPIPAPAAPSAQAVSRSRDFRLYWIGQSISSLGNQFRGIAGVWLVLSLTGDPLTLGLVLALASIPQALFSLFGGALIDRFSPRRAMLLADVLRLLLSACLAGAIFSGSLEIWMIFVYAFLMGAVSGLFEPASSSMLPRILSERELQKGNQFLQGTTQMIGILGPILAAGFIALSPDDMLAIATLIALDSITFLISLLTLAAMHAGGHTSPDAGRLSFAVVLRSTREGIAYVYTSPSLHFLFLIIAIASFSFAGPVMVGIPYLADTRFPDGVMAYGFILAGYAGGNLLGILLSSRLSPRDKKEIHIFLTGIFIAFGIGLAALAWISTTWLAALDLFVMGLLNGYISILLLTGVQRNTPVEMLGRVMSVVIFANLALMPFSQASAGAVLHWNVESLFLGAAALLFGAALYIYSSGEKYKIGERLL
jgi:MFS family permease